MAQWKVISPALADNIKLVYDFFKTHYINCIIFER